ncbi:uncharacterized protein LOC132926823 [Rhopalosiphum padi]|uniref:uncharacterized protein LOC132926823 n=1 Tax=Rhopalosiphum padi TaxID=40932 RepID=UPI00298E6708|nr:uncharacterized protein LOC132926823 [Rhopalosiphum padi]
MATTNKHKGGSVCAVSTCVNYSGKLKQDGISNISFHRFPKNSALQKEWILKCKRADNWNPSSSFICSAHFKDDEFIRDLQAELLGYAPKGRRLIPDVIPSLNLPGPCIQGNQVSTSTSNRSKRMEAKSSKQAHDEVITMALNTEIQSSSNESTLLHDSTEEPPEIIDYKCLYRDLLKAHDKLKTDLNLQENELISVKNSNESLIKINESLRSQLKQLQKNISNLNISIKKSQKSSSKQIKQLSVNKTRNIEIQARKYLSSVFSQNQLDLMMKKKKKVHWSRDEISKAFTLRYFSKRAYIYVKNELNYPLPGISSLQRWAKSIDMRNGVLGDVLKIMKLNGEGMQSYEKLTVLMFDEVKVASTLEYDVVRDEVIGPHSQMHVIMARGIASN